MVGFQQKVQNLLFCSQYEPVILELFILELCCFCHLIMMIEFTTTEYVQTQNNVRKYVSRRKQFISFYQTIDVQIKQYSYKVYSSIIKNVYFELFIQNYDTIITQNKIIEDNVSRKSSIMNQQTLKTFSKAQAELLPIYQYFSFKNLYINMHTQKMYESQIVKIQKQSFEEIVNVCKWRKCSDLPIVTIASIRVQKQLQDHFCTTIFVQDTLYRFQKISSISQQQALYLFKKLIPALQELVLRFGNFQVNQKNIVINLENEAKIWINQKLEQCKTNKLFNNQSDTIMSFIRTILNKSQTKLQLFSSTELITFQQLKFTTQRLQKLVSHVPTKFVQEKQTERQSIAANRYHNRSLSLNFASKTSNICSDKVQNFFKFQKRFHKRRTKKFMLLEKFKQSKQNTTEPGSNKTKFSIDESTQNINYKNWSQISQNNSNKDMAISLYKNLCMNQHTKQNTQGSFQFRPVTHKKCQSNLQALYSNNSQLCTVKRNSNFLFQEKKKIAQWFRDGDFAISMKKMEQSSANQGSSTASKKFDSEDDQINQRIRKSNESLKMILNCCQINSVSSVNSDQQDQKNIEKNKNYFQKCGQLIIQSLVEPQEDQYLDF